jgi:phage major head subunit gpT-like protein
MSMNSLKSRSRNIRRANARQTLGLIIQASAVAAAPVIGGSADNAIGQSFHCSAQVTIRAADEAQPDALPRFDIVAYNGGKMNVGWGYPLVVDLKGMQIASQANPVRCQHDAYMGVGHTDSVKVEANKLIISGAVSRETEAAREVVASSKKGFPWQASIGATPGNYRFVAKDEKADINGQSFDGPFYHVLESTFDEVSFVDLGADRTTSAKIAANDQGQTGAPVTTPTLDIQAAVNAAVTEAVNRVQANADRIAKINAEATGHPEILASAIKENWTLEKVQLEVLRASRGSAPFIHTSGNATVTQSVLEAAACQAAGLPHIEKVYDEKTLEASHKQFKSRISLQGLMLHCAWANGYQGYEYRGNEKEILRAAFGSIQATVFSTINVGGILSNTANKFLMQGFMAIEQEWRKIAAIRPVNDFKEISSYRLVTGQEYALVPATGEIKQGSLSEEKYGNKADTYGLMLAITRQDFRNDDLGAFTGVPMALGRKSGLKLNKVFWTEFMADGFFFTTGNKNYFEGAGTVLGVDSLSTAEAMFGEQTDANGDPIGVTPKFLVVPTRLGPVARQIYVSTELRPVSTSKEVLANPHAGRYTPVVSAYLNNTSIAGNSSTAWRLLADPNELPLIEACFLDGREEPFIESAEADFQNLGVQMRSYHDFGVRKQEFRAGVKSKGAA